MGDPLAGDDRCWAPLGAALTSYHLGNVDAEIVVRSDLWEDELIPASTFYRPNAQALPDLELEALARCCGRVLDLGAGAGRHALELQRSGHEVVAVDVLADAVRIMRDRGVTDARRGGFDAVRGERFDSVLMLMHGLGIAGTLRGLGDLLERLPGILAPGGSLICDSADLAAVLRLESPELLEELAHRERYLGEVEFSLRFGELRGSPYPWLFIDPDALETMADAAGFGIEIAARGERGSFTAELTMVGTRHFTGL